MERSRFLEVPTPAHFLSEKSDSRAVAFTTLLSDSVGIYFHLMRRQGIIQTVFTLLF